MSTSSDQNILTFGLQLCEQCLFLSNRSENRVMAKTDIYLNMSARNGSKAARRVFSHSGQPKGLPQAIKPIGGSGLHFRGWLFQSHLVT